MTPARHRGFRRLIPYVARHKARFLLGLLLVPVFTGIQLYIPRVFGSALEALQALGKGGDADRDGAFWIETVLLIAGLWLAHASLRFLSRYLQIGLSRLVEEELRNDLFNHLQRLPARFFDHARIGDLVSRSTQDIELLRFLAGPTLFFGVATLILIPGAMFQIVRISELLAITVVVLFGLVVVGLRFSFPRLAARSRAVQDAQADIASKAQEDFAGSRVLHAFAREETEVGAFARLADSCLASQVDMGKSRALLHSTFVTSGLIAPLAVILVGVAERLTISQLFQAYLYMQMLVWPLLIIGWILQTWHRARAAADRLDEMFDERVEEDRPPGWEATGPEPRKFPLEPSIEARGLSFRYTDEGPLVLENVRFRIAAHGTLGLVGPIGSGKTTLVSLLARLYDPPRGTLFLGGIDVCDIPLQELRPHFAVAPQDPFLFSDTLRANIEFGLHADGGRSEGELLDVLNASRLEEDLEAFPDRIDALVGERGVTLSGGQKQRTSLARALAARGRVLVLDDTLSAVDHDTERHILDRLRARTVPQTTIIIAHRLEAVEHADSIIVLDRGRIIDQGTHDQLVERGGWYARTWHEQRSGQAG